MSETANSEGLVESEKPVTVSDEVKFPPFPEPTDKDFEEDVPEEERIYYKNKFPDLSVVKSMRLHCTSCDRHLGSSARNVSRMRAHPMLRTLVCHTCHTFYNSGEFEKGDDGSELYCRWCGQGGQVYCCSNCPHVFCAKCIKRNFGAVKIKEIESTDDWKCFKCSPDCLKDLRASCWATLRYCDLKNEMTYKTEDPKLRELYQKDCAQDYTECCKHKNKRKEKESRKKDPEHQTRKSTAAASIISKIPPTIQVKKFASMSTDETAKPEKKAVKRPSSPKNTGIFIKNPIAIAPGPRLLNPISFPSPLKKIKVSPAPVIKFFKDVSNVATYSRVKQRPTVPPVPIMPNFNGFNNSRTFNNVNMVVSDNINLSLENLTQGLDMASMAAMSSNDNSQNDVVCTPDFPMEPLCEVSEDNDDDVQCISPDPVVVNYNTSNPPPLLPRGTALPDLSSDNIIQMTENDVTVNTVTGGLKFRVDPQTLSSNKMYRLPDGRVFAIKANPNMPGGYSATIVAVTENAKPSTPQGAIYAAKLSAVSNVNSSTPNNATTRSHNRGINTKRVNTLQKSKSSPATDMSRECDLSVPVEWYRYNLIDAVDALEYSLSRLNKLKKEATTMFLRTRNIHEMRNLHRTLERLLNTSSKRFNEIRENLNKELKQYISKKKGEHISDDDDDDVEILPDLDNDDPIFIDENSVDSNINDNESQKVDLTGACNSDHNDSEEKADTLRLETDPLAENCNSTVINSSDELQLSIGCNSSNERNNLHENKIDKDNVNKENDENNCIENDNNKNSNNDNNKLVCSKPLEKDGTKNQITDNKPVSKEKEFCNDLKQDSNEKDASADIKDPNEEKVSDDVNEDLSEKESSSHTKQEHDDIKQESNEKKV
ncbi:hypothetical protein O3G_MSEX010903 [Manduca sexta]|uniref:PHD-type domain-containing protein n=1 Tax=Manduca sexta TaxID=7130 RepID=A0A921ZIT2_MANSE|nr:hypothetical protein O3G_MSEX010903 [Manduca sexta]